MSPYSRDGGSCLSDTSELELTGRLLLVSAVTLRNRVRSVSDGRRRRDRCHDVVAPAGREARQTRRPASDWVF